MKTLYKLLSLLLLFGIKTKAQSIANYATTLSTGIAYNSVNTIGSPFGSWRNAAAFSQDDNRSLPSDIGFDFWYNGVRYTQISVSCNGFMDFSNSTANGTNNGAYGYDNSQFSAAGGTNASLTAFYDDLTAKGAVDALGTSIKYLLTGTTPNRVLTVEWINMAVYTNINPSLNYQVKLYETTGKIEFGYGTMNSGGYSFSYSCGISGATGGTGATQLKMQQTANGTTFNNTAQNNLSIMPTANNLIGFTPPVPANPTGALTFASVTNTDMVVNWATDWATNEVGYVLYNSTDGITYNFVAQTAPNSTSYTATSLLPATTYYWQVYAVTEGALSSSKNGIQATLVAGNKISNVITGNWNTATSWTPVGVPVAGDNVTIANGHTITINVNNATCNNLTIGQGTSGTLQIGNNNTARAMNFKNITVANGATFNVNTASATTHTLTTQGNIINNGTINFNSGTNLCNVVFNKEGSQSITGTATTNNYNRITVNLGTSINNVLDIASTNFSAATGFLTLTVGTIKFSSTGTVNVIPFNTGAVVAMDNKDKIWLASATTNLISNDGIDLAGTILIDNGTFTIGNATAENLQSVGGTVKLNGGILNIAGQYYINGINNLANFSIGGNAALNLPTIGSSSTTIAPFNITGVGSNFSMTGGTITILREGGTGAQDLGYVNTGSTTGPVTGGTLQIGNASTPAAQIISINTTYPVANLVVNSANVTANMVTNPLTVIDVTIITGTLLANNLNMNVGGNWTNAGTYTPGTNTTTFNGTSAQLIKKTGGEVFNNIVFTNAGIKTLGSDITTNGDLMINTGATLNVSATNYATYVKGNWINNGTFNQQKGLVEFNGTVAKTIGGSTITNFNNLTINNAAGVSLISDANLKSTLKLTAGTFTTTGKVFTLVSDATATARIDAITAGNITGNITMQRYIAPGATNWRMLASCTMHTILSDWNDDFAMSGFVGSQDPASTFNSVQGYDETQPGDLWDFGYVPSTNMTNAITTGKGYYCYIGPVPLTMETVGAPVKMNQTIPVTFTNTGNINNDGWNFVGNPYPSSIDWTAAAWTKTNFNNELHIWNPNSSSYASYVAGVGVNGGTQYVPSSQAFWVKANALNPVLRSTENCKSVVDQAFMRTAAPQAITDVFKLSLNGNGTNDEIAIRFTTNGTDTFDTELDANKLYDPYSGSPRFSSVMHNTTDYAINSLAPLSAALTIPLRAVVPASGTYSIVRDSVINLTKNVCITLEDLLTGTITDLTQNYSYTFTIVDTTKAPRFLLHFGNALAKNSAMPTCYNGANGKAIAIAVGATTHTFNWYDANNTLIKTTTDTTGVDTLIANAGIYKVIIDGNTGGCNILSDTITIPNPAPFAVNNTILHSTCNTSADGAIIIQSIAQGTAPYTYLWNNGNTSNTLQNLTGGNYTVQITDANNCTEHYNYTITPTNVVNANFSINDDSVFLYQASIIFNNYSTAGVNYSWDFGDGTSSADATPVHKYQTFGTYSATLIAEKNGCTDSKTTIVVVLDSVLTIEPVDTSKTGILTLLNKTIVSNYVKLATINNSYELLLNYPAATLATIKVLATNSKLVYSNEQTITQTTIVLPTANWASGEYYMTIRSNYGLKTFKILLQN